MSSVWKKKYKSPEDYYHGEFDTEFYYFDELQLEIDPDETLEDFEKYDITQQTLEIEKCVRSFAYFCHKYVKILHPTKGLIPFIMYKYQARSIEYYNTHRFNIISKFRQGGLTTVTLLYGLWKCMFELDQQIMALSKTDREAVGIGMMVDRAVEHMPSWIKPKKDGKWNDHLKQFPDTGGALQFFSPEAARGKSVTFLIIDEAAFIPDMENHWKAMWPVLSTGGSCVLVSTVNGLGNWYEMTYTGAKEGKNMFHVIDLDYWEHPDYSPKNNPNWEKEQRSQLGEKGFMQEVLRSFLGSGETFIPSEKLTKLDALLRNSNPFKRLFPAMCNKDSPEENENEFEKGAFWIWQEPKDGADYILGVDCAEGIGTEGDNSCIQVLNMNTLEQAAEFYSNLITPHEFAHLLHEIATAYNTGLIIVEDMSAGGIVIDLLVHEFAYENMFYSNKNQRANKPGIKMSVNVRPLVLQTFQSRVLNDALIMKSKRLLNELKTFEFNITTKKAEAARGKHDDAIMAMAMAIWGRDQTVRDIPLGTSALEGNGAVRQASVADIRAELRKGLRESIFERVSKKEKTLEDLENENVLKMYRKQNALLKDFGW